MNDLSDPLLPYQKRVIEAVGANDVVVIEKSRRIGISWVLSWLAVMTAGAGKSAGGMDVFYMGYEKDMTRQFIEDCATHAEILNFGAKEVGEACSMTRIIRMLTSRCSGSTLNPDTKSCPSRPYRVRSGRSRVWSFWMRPHSWTIWRR